jgi:hypothetical protein
MKTLLLITLFVTQGIACIAQSVVYHLPEKKLRITATYKLTAYVLMSGADHNVIDRKYELVITDPVKVEEVVVPDEGRRFEVRMPERLSSGGARFEWKVQLDRSGILTGWNASREPVTTQVLTGMVGFVANVLTSLTPVSGVLPASAEKPYKIDTEQKFTVTELIDIPATGLNNVTVADPKIDMAQAHVPTVTITLTPVHDEVSGGDAIGGTDVLHYIEPRAYRLHVDVNNNGLVPSTRVIDAIILVPQHGALRSISLTGLFKGRKAAAVSFDPATGQLLSWEYKRSGNTRTETADLSKQLASLAEAVSSAQSASERRLEQEVSRLSLELQRLELERKLRDVERNR